MQLSKQDFNLLVLGRKKDALVHSETGKWESTQSYQSLLPDLRVFHPYSSFSMLLANIFINKGNSTGQQRFAFST